MKKITFLLLLASLAINSQTITFDGNNDLDGGDGETWGDALNWDLNIVPTTAHDVVIPDGFTAKIKTAGAVANSIDASGTGKIQINAEKSLTVTGNLVGGSNSNIFFVTATGKNMGTLIFGGTYTGGNTSAKIRLPNNNKWHLISAPLKQATINNFINDATTIVLNTAGDKYSLATYNDGNPSGSKYTYFPNPLPNTTDKLQKGQGYSTLLDNTTDPTKPDMQFKGKFNDVAGDVLSPTLVYEGNGFVLLGNPFPAYIYANVNADLTKNILTVNSGKLEEETIWLWDSANSAWVTINQSSPAYHLAPGQGFFVKVPSDVSGSFRTNNDMQTHTKTDGFYRIDNNTRFGIDLSVSANSFSTNTSVRYIESTTKDFDNGYDSSMFGGYDSELAVYTELVENNTGKKLAIQSLPNSNYENMVIPVGVNAAAASDITFTAEAFNLPVGYAVYLEDRTNNTFKRLDEANAEYTVNVEAGNTIGRFYLHATTSTLSTDSEILNSVSIYKTTNNNIKITGLQSGNATISLYNLLGKQVVKTSFQSSNVNNIALPNLSAGVYIVKLEAENDILNKKIILE